LGSGFLEPAQVDERLRDTQEFKDLRTLEAEGSVGVGNNVRKAELAIEPGLVEGAEGIDEPPARDVAAGVSREEELVKLLGRDAWRVVEGGNGSGNGNG
jgi:hypothetical protein